MNLKRKSLFLAVLFIPVLLLFFSGNAVSYDTHVDGATIDSNGGWELPTDLYPSAGSYDGDDQCLRCHSDSGCPGHPSGPCESKESYLMTGHRNMIREVVAGVPLGGPEWTAGEVGSSPYAEIDWGNAEVIGSGKGAGSLLFVYGGWMRNGVEARITQTAKNPDSPSDIETGDSSYCGAYCHTTGPNAVDATDHAPGITGTTFKATGIQCTRCHDKSSDLPGEVPSSHYDAIPAGAGVTELCYECHKQSGVQPYEVAASQSSFIEYYRTNQFLNSPHARLTGADIGNSNLYDSFFYGGCTTCHDVHIGAEDPANDGDDHITNRCGIECHNPQSLPEYGGYKGFHDYFGGVAPDTTSTEDNCSEDYNNQSDCEDAGGYWNPAGTKGNNPKACVICHMGPGTNHLFRNNVDPSYTPFPTTPGMALTYDEEGYAAVGNDLGLICGQCHYPEEELQYPKPTTIDQDPIPILSLDQLAFWAEDYHGIKAAAASAVFCATSGSYCINDDDCTGSVCSRTRTQLCTTDDDCPTNETCVVGGEICQHYSQGTDVTYFRWYRGAGCPADCYAINFDASMNIGSAYNWNFGDGSSGSGEVVNHCYPSEGSYLATLTVDGSSATQRTFNISALEYPSYVGKPTKISGVFPAYYLTLQEAYDNAVNGTTIHMKDTSLDGDINFDSTIAVSFQVGYDCTYNSIIGATALNGNVTISNGSVKLQNGILIIM